MAILLYPSGITEMFEPKELVFTDQELLDIFKDYTFIKTARLQEVPNTWCVWGQNKTYDEGDFNKLGSDILLENVYCAVLFIHDTQIDPAWTLTDNVIYKGYEQFKEDLLRFFDHIADNVLIMSQKTREQQGKETNLIFLNAIGPTVDKRVLFEFDPNKQSKEFYNDNSFVNFADKVIEFLKNDYKIQDTFYIYHDKKTLIFIRDEHVGFLIDSIISALEIKERYESCQELKYVYEQWKKYKQNKNKKRRK